MRTASFITLRLLQCDGHLQRPAARPRLDSGQVSALCLLDLTAACDNVDHDLLLLRLERQFGSSRTCLTDHFVSSISTRRHPLFTMSASALYPRGKYSVHDSSSCIRQTLPNKYSSSM